MSSVIFSALLILNPPAAAVFIAASVSMGERTALSLVAAYGTFATAGLVYALNYALKNRA